MSSTNLNNYLHKSFDEICKYGKTNGYRVFKTYSEPAELIVDEKDKISSPNRLEVKVYVGKDDDTYVSHITRYIHNARLDDFDIDSQQTPPTVYTYLKSVFPNESQLKCVMNKMGQDTNDVFVFIGKASSGKSLFAKFITQLYPEKFSAFNYLDDRANEKLTVELSKNKPIIICVNSLNEIKHLNCWEKIYLVPFESNFKPVHNMYKYISGLADEYRVMKSLMSC